MRNWQIIVPDKYDTSKTGFSNYAWTTMTMIDVILKHNTLSGNNVCAG